MIEMEEFYPWCGLCWWAVWYAVIDFTPHIDLLVGTPVVFLVESCTAVMWQNRKHSQLCRMSQDIQRILLWGQES
jgi:hypothetical protein